MLKTQKKKRLPDRRLPVEFGWLRCLVADDRGGCDGRDRGDVRYRRRVCKTPGWHVVRGNGLLARVYRLIERHRDHGLKAAESGVPNVFGHLRRQSGGGETNKQR